MVARRRVATAGGLDRDGHGRRTDDWHRASCGLGSGQGTGLRFGGAPSSCARSDGIEPITVPESCGAPTSAAEVTTVRTPCTGAQFVPELSQLGGATRRPPEKNNTGPAVRRVREDLSEVRVERHQHPLLDRRSADHLVVRRAGETGVDNVYRVVSGLPHLAATLGGRHSSTKNLTWKAVPAVPCPRRRGRRTAGSRMSSVVSGRSHLQPGSRLDHRGSGTFTGPANFPAAGPHSVAVGQPDLAGANADSNSRRCRRWPRTTVPR